MGSLIVASSFVLFPATLFASAYGTATWQGAWRKLAAVPLLAVIAYFAVILIPDWITDPTSHNLFPFELGIYLSPTIVFMGIVLWRHQLAEPQAPVRELLCGECGRVTRPGPATCACGASLKRAIKLR